MTLVLVLLGGAVGAPLRYLVDLHLSAPHDSVLPWGTLTVNVSGSLLLGLVAGAVTAGGAPSWLLALLGTGLCGALTTFSTFGYETVRLVQDRSWGLALLNVTGSVLASYAAVAAGWWLAGRA
ncbi:MAG TPA: fluoride efflux transporter CrcB [Dermatophilaceae bacterium]|nr:fluoride efflux transporter CrcB [Dermatophilaceae bacterium]